MQLKVSITNKYIAIFFSSFVVSLLKVFYRVGRADKIVTDSVYMNFMTWNTLYLILSFGLVQV